MSNCTIYSTKITQALLSYKDLGNKMHLQCVKRHRHKVSSQYIVYLIVTGLLILANRFCNSILFVIEGLLPKRKIILGEIYTAS